MRIFQMTDLHIGQENENPNGIDVRENFLQILQRIEKYAPDSIVISGDLSYRKGDKKTYRWIRDQLAGSGYPLYVIAGNHDDASLLGSVFHPDKPLTADNKLYYFVKKREELFLYLDTANGMLGKEQMDWIREITGRYQPDRLFVFMHHPPVPAGVPHMDDGYALKDGDTFAAWCQVLNRPVYVFTGHYHVSKSLVLGRLFIQICPSSFFQIDETSTQFLSEHQVPGFTVIDVLPDSVRTQVHYCL